jgi:molybdate transport system substrate-binding protein
MVALLLAGCGGGADEPEEAAGTSSTAPRASLTILAASSLEPALSAWEAEVERELNLDISFSFSSSSVAARQVVEGAPADVLLTADGASMDVAADAGAVDEPEVFARNSLALVVGKGNPKGVAGLGDLAKEELTVVLCDADVPCGRLAAGLLEDGGIEASVDSFEENVSAAVGKVALGEADATMGYRSDVVARADKVESVLIPGTDNRALKAEYLAAVVKQSQAKEAARRFVAELVSGDGQELLAAAGFEPSED